MRVEGTSLNKKTISRMKIQSYFFRYAVEVFHAKKNSYKIFQGKADINHQTEVRWSEVHMT